MKVQRERKNTSVNFDTTLHSAIVERAQLEKRTTNAQIEWLCEQALTNGERLETINIERIARAAGAEEAVVLRIVTALRAAQ